MTKHVKHGFIGEKEGDAIAKWLNQKTHRGDREGLMEIITAVKSLDAALEMDFHAGLGRADRKRRKAGKKSFTIGAKVPPSRRYVVILRRVDRLLSDCWMRPRLGQHGGARYTFIWKYQRLRSEGVHLLTQIMELGLVDRIRTCAKPGCGAWFFAKFSGGKYCSKVCQRRDYQSSDPWKKRRRQQYQKARLGHFTPEGSVSF